MKFIFKLLLVAALVGAGIYIGLNLQKKSEGQTIEDKAKTTAETAKDAVRDAVTKTGDAVKEAAEKTWDATKEKVGSVVTNVTGEIKQGAQKVGEKVKDAIP